MTNKSQYDEICKACGICNGTLCAALLSKAEQKTAIPNQLPQNYSGVRFTADAMDCALPISMDSHSGCSYNCVYCFANNLSRAPDRNMAKLEKCKREGTLYSEWPIKKLERFLDRGYKDPISIQMYNLLDYGLPVQLGALGDPLDDIEEATGWLLKAIPLFIKYKVPVRVSTKGARVMMQKKYRDLFHQNPQQFWFAFSTICNSDELISQIDINAPVTSERLKAVKAYSKEGHPCSLRFRPFLPGISDSYPGEPNAWDTLMTRFADAGAIAVSFEYIFLNSSPTKRQKALDQLMFRIMRNPKFGEFWHGMSNSRESCRRGSRSYKSAMSFAVRNRAHELGMYFGCSDPHFKELNDFGCCCGIPPDFPWFGNWSRRQLTNVIVEMRKAFERGERLQVSYRDWYPEWSHNVNLSHMVNVGNWHTHRMKKFYTTGDNFRSKWNNPRHPRSPYTYFAGVMRPVGIDTNTNDLVYEYREWFDGFDKKFKGEVHPSYADCK